MLRWPALVALILLATPAEAPAGGGAGRGLWVGPIQVCRDTATQVMTGSDRSGGATATVTLRSQWRERLRRETERRVGRPLAVRLNGRLLFAPTVREPITGGVVELHGPSQAQMEAIRAAAGRAC